MEGRTDGRKKEWMERGRMDQGKRKARKEDLCMYVCSCVYNCKTEHATVGLLSLFFISFLPFPFSYDTKHSE